MSGATLAPRQYYIDRVSCHRAVVHPLWLYFHRPTKGHPAPRGRLTFEYKIAGIRYHSYLEPVRWDALLVFSGATPPNIDVGIARHTIIPYEKRGMAVAPARILGEVNGADSAKRYFLL
jgi:hypothetical protein